MMKNDAQKKIGDNDSWETVSKKKRKVLAKSRSDSEIGKISQYNHFNNIIDTKEMEKGDIENNIMTSSNIITHTSSIISDRSLINKLSTESNILPKTRIVPGVKSYSKAHTRTTLIISDSIINRILAYNLKNNIDLNSEEIIMKNFVGATAEEISHYAAHPLTCIQPSQVIIIGSTNDISRQHRDKILNEESIVNNILYINRKAKEVGADRIFVSNILVRWGHKYKDTISCINNILELMCREEGFLYFDQSDITTRHISKDGLHPNKYGIVILKMNL